MDLVTKQTKEIYIQLLNEGSEVWRPTQAIPLGGGLYRILPTSNYDPEDETWEFVPGSVVVCKEKQLSLGLVLVAVKKAS